MAENTQGVVDINVQPANKSIAELKKELQGATEQLELLDKDSAAFSECAQKVSQLTGQLREANEAIEFSSRGLYGIAEAGMQTAAGITGGFQSAQAALNLFGVESEATTEAIAKMQSLMALTQGLQGLAQGVKAFKALTTVIKTAVIAQKAQKAATVAETAATTAQTAATGAATTAQLGWNAALAANPIGAIITVISLLIVGLSALIGWLMDDTEETENAEKAQEAYNAEIDNFVQKTEAYNAALAKMSKQHSQELELMQASGATEEELHKAKIENWKTENKQRLANYKLLKAEYDQKIANLKLEGKIRVENGQYIGDKNTIEGIKDMQAALNGFVTAYNDTLHDIKVEEASWQTKLNKEQADSAKKLADESASAAKKAADEKISEEKRAKDEAAKLQQEELKQIETLYAEMEKASRTDRQNEIQELTDKYEQEKALLEKYHLDTTTLTEQYRNAVKEVNNRYDDEEAAKKAQEKADALAELEVDEYLTEEESQSEHLATMQANLEEAREKGLITEEQYTAGVKKLAEERAAAEAETTQMTIDNAASLANGLSDILGSIASMQDTSTKEGFEAAKKLQIAQATINMITGIATALSGAFTTKTGPWDIALAAVQAATIAASGIANITKISQTQFDSGSSAASTAASAINSTVIAPTQYTQAVSDAQTTEAITSTRVYVTEGDITKTQSKVSVAESEARF